MVIGAGREVWAALLPWRGPKHFIFAQVWASSFSTRKCRAAAAEHQRKMAAAMNAMLTKYLKDFSVPESTALVEQDLLSSLASSPLDNMTFLPEPQPEIDVEAERKGAFDEGYDQARSEYEQRFAGELASIVESHEEELRQIGERHEEEVMRVIHARFFDMTVAISQSVADQTLQALLPIIDADVARRSVNALADAVRKAMTEEKAADVLVRGPMRLYEMLRPKFDERGIACRHVEAETIDIIVEINETVLTTRLSVWAQSLAEVME